MSQQINLANPLLLRKRYVFGVREMGLALVAIVALALAWAGYQHYRARALDAEATEHEARAAQAQHELDRLSAAIRPPSALLAERVSFARAQTVQREAVLASLEGVIEKGSKGFSERLRALAHGRIDGVWLNGFVLSADYVSLEGSALSVGLVGDYIERLGRQAPFAGMKFSGMEAAAPRGADPARQDADAPLAAVDFTLYSGNAPGSTEGKPHAP
ncbi:hypothetical protein Tbd_0761 [Thiobacillus denitrificans ATCC 25259]|uniref:MSHA biogenesis protein MshI n=1 Tax=Thiobacillus denitrificans (strain ATCC 25259 / T1) TaxID=292415 RepID=Q3SKR1_THIDA|nr:PilN domain-containing protein [Thiobacillus denitrificans]AAZ96714.1 hypothetical protein Tbd_0761 [Thiobacillus denitrificans ATCC 25259]